MEKAFDDLNGTLKVFRQARALKYEKKYNREHNAEQKNARYAELYDKVEKALGTAGSQLLKDYTDCVIALYNTDADYFYNCGFNDSQQIYSKLFNLSPPDCDGEQEDEDGAWLDTKEEIK